MAASGVSRSVAFVLSAFVCCSCGGSTNEAASARHGAGAPVLFDFTAMDGSHLSSETMRGRMTAVAFITTYDLPSQVLVRELSDLVRRKTPRVNAFAVALEPPKNAPLVDTFAQAMDLGFPVALADAATLEQRGPFGPIPAVPTLIVLGPDGAERVRREGVVPPADLDRALTDR